MGCVLGIEPNRLKTPSGECFAGDGNTLAAGGEGFAELGEGFAGGGNGLAESGGRIAGGGKELAAGGGGVAAARWGSAPLFICQMPNGG